jgi:hypothetical protein
MILFMIVFPNLFYRKKSGKHLWNIHIRQALSKTETFVVGPEILFF